MAAASVVAEIQRGGSQHIHGQHGAGGASAPGNGCAGADPAPLQVEQQLQRVVSLIGQGIEEGRQPGGGRERHVGGCSAFGPVSGTGTESR